MMEHYNKNNIKTFPVNVSKEGHNKLSILDRLVRTIRDMGAQVDNDEEYTPEKLKQLAIIYNNSKHTTLTKILSYQSELIYVSDGVSPSDMFHYRILEIYFVSILRSMNWSKQKEIRNFIIKDGSRVFVKDSFSKRRNTFPGTWFVQKHKGQTYEVKCEETKQVLNVSRDKILLCNN